MSVHDSNSQRDDSVVISLEESAETETGSPPYLSSHLLCPSNLGALLESTTATLVSGGWREANGEDTSKVLEEGRSEAEEAAEMNLPELSHRVDVVSLQNSSPVL